MRFPLLVRGAIIAAVAFSILFPLKLIEGKIHERQMRADGVERQFAQETSGRQSVAGPFLALTCEETFTEEREIMRAGKAETVAEKRVGPCPTGYFPPRTLKVAGKVPVESLHRGIYPIRLYRGSLEMTGEIEWPAPAVSTATRQRAWKQAYVVMHVSDPRGIKEIQGNFPPARGQFLASSFAYQAPAGNYDAKKAGEKLPFEFRMQLVGTQSLLVAPVGDATEIRLTSDWPHPSFTGAYSPDARKVTREGFEATWRTTLHATGGQPAWEKRAKEGKLDEASATAGVAFVDPVNIYALSYRATEYGFLFVLFTFAALALTEALAGVRLHAIQYALVGSALAVFFLLLVALSEHIAFASAYLAAAGACVALLTFYLRHPLGTRARAAAFFTYFTGLYGALYVLLNSEDHALLLGSIMVFAVLAVAMIATRRLDWSAFARPASRAPVAA